MQRTTGGSFRRVSMIKVIKTDAEYQEALAEIERQGLCQMIEEG
jgi:hypothetical protein